MPKLSPWLKLAALALFLVAAWALFRDTRPAEVLDRLETAAPVTQRVAYVAFYVVGTALLVPGTALSFPGGVLFGVYEGTLWTWLGACLGATVAFLAARWLGREAVARRFGQGRLEALDRTIQERGFAGLLIVRLLPLFPFNLVNFGCGLTGMRLRDYLLATAVGIVPGTFVYQYLFAKLGRRFLTEGAHWADLADPEISTTLGLFVGFVLVGQWLAGRYRRPAPPA